MDRSTWDFMCQNCLQTQLTCEVVVSVGRAWPVRLLRGGKAERAEIVWGGTVALSPRDRGSATKGCKHPHPSGKPSEH